MELALSWSVITSTNSTSACSSISFIFFAAEMAFPHKASLLMQAGELTYMKIGF
jgi:hypothetical protein